MDKTASTETTNGVISIESDKLYQIVLRVLREEFSDAYGATVHYVADIEAAAAAGRVVLLCEQHQGSRLRIATKKILSVCRSFGDSLPRNRQP